MPYSSTIGFLNWAGYEKYRTTSDGIRIRAVRGWFNNTNCDNVGDHATWVGLGGVYDKTLWQIGWDAKLQTWWYELFYRVNGVLKDTGEMPLTLGGTEANCGLDQGYLYVDRNFEITNGVYGYLLDVSTHYYTSLGFTNIYVDQESGEWIDERISCGYNGTSLKLYDPGTYLPTYRSNWRGNFWYTNSTAYHDIWLDSYYNAINMVDANNGNILVSASVLTGGEYFYDARTAVAATDVQC